MKQFWTRMYDKMIQRADYNFAKPCFKPDDEEFLCNIVFFNETTFYLDDDGTISR